MRKNKEYVYSFSVEIDTSQNTEVDSYGIAKMLYNEIDSEFPFIHEASYNKELKVTKDISVKENNYIYGNIVFSSDNKLLIALTRQFINSAINKVSKDFKVEARIFNQKIKVSKQFLDFLNTITAAN